MSPLGFRVVAAVPHSSQCSSGESLLAFAGGSRCSLACLQNSKFFLHLLSSLLCFFSYIPLVVWKQTFRWMWHHLIWDSLRVRDPQAHRDLQRWIFQILSASCCWGWDIDMSLGKSLFRPLELIQGLLVNRNLEKMKFVNWRQLSGSNALCEGECPVKGLKNIRNARCGKERFLFSLISEENSGVQTTTESLSSGGGHTGTVKHMSWGLFWQKERVEQLRSQRHQRDYLEWAQHNYFGDGFEE